MSPEYKRDPYVAAVRKDMADVYRKVRKDSPAMARLLKRRNDAAYEEMKIWFNNKVYNEGTGFGGSLHSLFK